MSADPAERVGEFLRQWHYQARDSHHRHVEPVIYGVHFDPNAEMAELRTTDLKVVLAWAKAYRDQS